MREWSPVYWIYMLHVIGKLLVILYAGDELQSRITAAYWFSALTLPIILHARTGQCTGRINIISTFENHITHFDIFAKL